MSVYTNDQEQRIRVKRRADEWMRSGLMDAAQHARIAADLQVDLRRTNRFLRVTLFAFGFLIVGAATGLVAVTLETRSRPSTGILCLAAAAACAVLGELLIRRFRVYRFGVEEACVVASIVLAAGGCGLLLSLSAGNGSAFAALVAGSFASFVAYRRFGYVYAAAGAVACVSLAMFQNNLPEAGERVLAGAALGGCAVAARVARRGHDDEFPADDHAAIEAMAWLGLYATLNLRVFTAFSSTPPAAWFYWTTYGMIWLLPAAGLWLSIRDKNRLLLDASLVMALATLVTNKPYLGAVQKPWDPIVLGLLLIGVAIAVRRWLASGDERSRRGFTATRLLRSDRDTLTAAGLASAAFHPVHDQPRADPPPPDLFESGRSGGGGGGASY